jgi:predicted site-specific integrase-resolvase
VPTLEDELRVAKTGFLAGVPRKRLIGYARVSTYRQTLDSQLEQLRAAGCSSRNTYCEKVTGARADRRELNRTLGKLAPGDVVTATRMTASRAAPSIYSASLSASQTQGAIPVTGGPWAGHRHQHRALDASGTRTPRRC